jgi:CheY-like chemotaxis protein
MDRAHPNDKVVVVIDDDALVLEAMSGLLRGWGYQVVAAANDDLALDLLMELGRRPDLIICDYRLSQGRIGVDAIDRVRKAFEIPAFVISADAVAHGRRGGGEQYRVLSKPVTPVALQTAVSTVLDVDSLSGDDD